MASTKKVPDGLGNQIRKSSFSCTDLASFRVDASYAESIDVPPNDRDENHVHRECEIYVNMSGNVSFMVEGRMYPVFPGSIIITRPYEYHYCVYHSHDIHKHCCVWFSTEGNEDLFPKFFEREAGEKNLLILSINAQEKLFKLCRELVEPQQTEVEKIYRFFSLLHLLDTAEQSDSSGELCPTDVTEVLEYINHHFSEPLVIGELARMVHVSINTLERHFEETLHMSPSAYLKKRRLARAAELLHENFSVMEACENSGFSDYSGFIALFKKAYGVTPLTYKKQMRSR
ncbi:MAG: AraC family transcriptional regulator [Ruminococcaceae bacterium]|nr:AraC family transcriptional regulator [Oscillospiraceae bacterium]